MKDVAENARASLIGKWVSVAKLEDCTSLDKLCTTIETKIPDNMKKSSTVWANFKAWCGKCGTAAQHKEQMDKLDEKNFPPGDPQRRYVAPVKKAMQALCPKLDAIEGPSNFNKHMSAIIEKKQSGTAVPQDLVNLLSQF